MLVELGLDDDCPDIHAHVQENDSEETDLCASPLAETLHVKEEAKAKTSDYAEERRDEG